MLFVFVHFRKGCYHSACLYVDGLFSIVIAFCAELAWLVVSITPSLAVLSLTLHLENCLVLYPGPPWLIQSGGWGNLFNINDLLGNILLQFGTPNEWMPWLEQIVVLPTSRSCSQEFGWAFGLGYPRDYWQIWETTCSCQVFCAQPYHHHMYLYVHGSLSFCFRLPQRFVIHN